MLKVENICKSFIPSGVKDILFLGILFLFTLPVFAQNQNAFEDSIMAIMQRRPTVGLSVAVVKDGKMIYNKSFGYKDLEKKTPLENNNIFRIASISKSFTVTSLMQQVEKKRLTLDDDVSDLVGFKIRNPKFPDTRITLRMILSHTSSLSDANGYYTLDVINPAKNKNTEKCYNDYAPGTDYQYCNLNLNIAGTILERISGERFDHYVVDHVLTPLGLYGGYNIDELDANLFAPIYEYNWDSAKFFVSPDAYASRKKEIEQYVMGYSTPIFSPTGGMKISARDLAKYMMMHMNGGKLNGVRIIRKNHEMEMRKPLSQKELYGMGLHTTTNLIEGKMLIGHTGVAYGLYSSMFFEPKKKFGIVVISNGCDQRYVDGFNGVIREVTNALYDGLIRKEN
ncbi:MAG: beta-lactamase family protein [Chitinophagaceae bacterium]|nr:beta-lactamase family protein [Chitinophagaceae bacterium]